jgi:hypothetical protein
MLNDTFGESNRSWLSDLLRYPFLGLSRPHHGENLAPERSPQWFSRGEDEGNPIPDANIRIADKSGVSVDNGVYEDLCVCPIANH